MKKLMNSKRAVNDVSMIWTIVVILFALGAIVPIINSYFSNTSTDYKQDELADQIGQDLPGSDADQSTVSGIELLGSIALMFFWSFDIIWPLQLLILEPMRIILYVLIYRQIRSGGG